MAWKACKPSLLSGFCCPQQNVLAFALGQCLLLAFLSGTDMLSRSVALNCAKGMTVKYH